MGAGETALETERMRVETEDRDGVEGIPGDPASVYQAATAFYQQKRYAEIVDLCERAEAGGTYDGGVAAVHSVALMKLHRTDETVDFLHHMLQYFPNDARLHFNLGVAYQTLYKRREANAEFEIARRLDPQVVGQKVGRLTIIRFAVPVVAFAAFFTCLLFWPHTKWVLVGLISVLIALTAVVLVMAVRAGARNRILINAGMLALWLVLLGLVLFAPVNL